MSDVCVPVIVGFVAFASVPLLFGWASSIFRAGAR